MRKTLGIMAGRNPRINIEYLVIAGGGSAGPNTGGGGGAGGYRVSKVGETSGGGAASEPVKQLTFGKSFTVTVGTANNNSVLDDIVSLAGGSVDAKVGGSGCGNSAADGIQSNAGTAGQGYASGLNVNGDGGFGGGGGGAGAAGSSKNGGNGQTSSITGVAVTRGGGGGGGEYATASNNGAGGTGGGGAGGRRAFNDGRGVDGSPNTGGGAGGGSWSYLVTGQGGTGGTGVVIIAYPNTSPNFSSIGAGLTYTLDTTTRAGYKVYTFTAGTGTVTL